MYLVNMALTAYDVSSGIMKFLNIHTKVPSLNTCLWVLDIDHLPYLF